MTDNILARVLVLSLGIAVGCADASDKSSVGESPTGTYLEANDGFGEYGYSALDEACDNTDDPKYMQRFVTPMFRDVAVLNDVAYAVDGSLLWAVSVLDPTLPERISLTRLPGHPVSVVVGPEDRLLVANGTSALLVVDVSDPVAPVVASEMSGLPGRSLDVAVAGNVAYVACGDGGLATVDVTVPDTPEILDGLPLAGFANGVDVENGIAYVAACSNLGVVNAVDPGALEDMDTVWMPDGLAREIDVTDGEAYVAAGEALFRYDVSDATNVEWIGYYADRYADGFYINAVVVQDDVAYIAAGDESFRAVDVTLMPPPQDFVPIDEMENTVTLEESIQVEVPPATIQIISSDPIGIGIQDDLLFVLGNFRWVGERLMRILDISTPGAMIALGDYEQPNETVGMDKVEGRVLVHRDVGREFLIDSRGDLVHSFLLPDNVARTELVDGWLFSLLDDGNVYVSLDGSDALASRVASSMFDLAVGSGYVYMSDYSTNEITFFESASGRVSHAPGGTVTLESALVGFSRLLAVADHVYAYDWAMGTLSAFGNTGQLTHVGSVDAPLCEAYDLADFYSGQATDRSRLLERAGDLALLCPYDDYGKSSVMFYSLSDPAAPELVDRWVLPDGRYRDMIIVDDAVYTLGFDNNTYRTTVHEVTEGSVETLEFDGHGNRLLSVGGDIWVADGDFGVRRFTRTATGFEELARLDVGGE